MIKTYCLDTSVLLDNPRIIDDLKKSQVVIPFCVLSELDKKRKDGTPNIRKKSREAVRYLENIMSQGDILEGITTPEGTLVKVNLTPYDVHFDNDLKIILCAKNITEKNVVLLSNDIGLRLRACSHGVKAEGTRQKDQDSLYNGIIEIDVDQDVLEDLYDHGIVHISDHIKKEHDLFLNQLVILNAASVGMARVIQYEDKLCFKKFLKQNIWGITPRNIEQTCATELLMDPGVQMVSMVGKSGGGKTFLAAAAALEQVVNKNLYEKIMIIRPTVSVGEDIGFLPGDLHDKLAPWIMPLKDNLKELMKTFLNRKETESMFMNGIIELQHLGHIRGRSLTDTFIIVDECQNVTPQQIKAILTRAGEGTKVVLTGDIEQIDGKMDATNNGLSHAIERLKEYEFTGHVTLQKGQRSDLANISAEVL